MTESVGQATVDELSDKMDWLLESPKDGGVVRGIVVRPATDERQELEQVRLSPEGGVEGDRWASTAQRKLEDGRLNPDVQVTLTNARLIEIVAKDRSRWGLSGDQLYVDMDLSIENLQPGQRLAIGSAVLEISEVPHRGCSKYTSRFGKAAFDLVDSARGRELRFRGVYAQIVQEGTLAVGDRIHKV